MRKWLWLAAASFVLTGAGVWWYFELTRQSVDDTRPTTVQNPGPCVLPSTQEGDAGLPAPTVPGPTAPADGAALPSPPTLTTHVEAAYPEQAFLHTR